MNTANPGRVAWTTHDECLFIKQLYEFRGPNVLRSYLDSCRFRVRWDDIDKKVTMAKARRLLVMESP